MMKKMFHRENNLSNLNKCKEYSLMVNQLFLGPKRRISSFFHRFKRWNIHTAFTNNRHAWENEEVIKLIHFIGV